MFLVHRFFSPWGWRRYVPPKRRLLQEPHSVTSQKMAFFVVKKTRTNSVAFSPQANYINRVTTPCWWNLVSTFADRGCRVVSAVDPVWSLISAFWTGAATFLSSSSSFILTRAEWTQFQTNCYSENLAAPGIEPGTSGLAARRSLPWKPQISHTLCCLSPPV
jgi:hypothetical protein